MSPQAFTLKSDSLLQSLISSVMVQQDEVLCKNFKLTCKQRSVDALWDTGSTCSCISMGLAKSLGLKVVDVCDMMGVGGVHSSNVYQVDLLLPSHASLNAVSVTEFVDNGEFDIIIGMDIIMFGDFAISNSGDRTTMSFRVPPRDIPIDFVKELKGV